jgi:hypothetical protein
MPRGRGDIPTGEASHAGDDLGESMNLIPSGRNLRRTGFAVTVAAVFAVTGFASVVVAAEPLAPAVAAEAYPTSAAPSSAPATSDTAAADPAPEFAAEESAPSPTPGSAPAPTVPSDPVPSDPVPSTSAPTATGTPTETDAATANRAVATAPIGTADAAAEDPAPQVPSTAPKCVPGFEAAPAGERGYICGDADSYDPEETTQPVPAISGEVRMAVVGDSLSSGSTQRLETIAQADAGTWVSTAIQNDKVAYAGGWAQWGSTSTQQATAVYPVDCDLLVMLTGTNDIRSNIDFNQQMLDMNHIANVLGAPRVLVLALPPNNKFASESLVRDRNIQLQQYATVRGWDFYDPWSGFRNGERWVTGANMDDYHPTNATHAVVGQRIGDYVAGHYAPVPATV